MILNNSPLWLSPQSAYRGRKRNENEDTEATLGCKSPVIDIENDDDDDVIDLSLDDEDVNLARDKEDTTPLLGEWSTWGLRARASGLPEIWELLPHEPLLRKGALGRGAMELVGYVWYSSPFWHLSGSHLDKGKCNSLSTKL